MAVELPVDRLITRVQPAEEPGETIGPLVAILMPTVQEPVSHDEHELDEHGHGGHH